MFYECDVLRKEKKEVMPTAMGEGSVASEISSTPAFPGMEVKQMKLKNTLEAMSLGEEEFKTSFMSLNQESSGHPVLLSMVTSAIQLIKALPSAPGFEIG